MDDMDDVDELVDKINVIRLCIYLLSGTPCLVLA